MEYAANDWPTKQRASYTNDLGGINSLEERSCIETKLGEQEVYRECCDQRLGMSRIHEFKRPHTAF